MNKKIPYLSVNPNASLEYVIKKFYDKKIENQTHGIVAVVKNRKLVGVITSSDILREISKNSNYLYPISKYMTLKPVVYVSEDDHFSNNNDIFLFLNSLKKIPEFLPIIDKNKNLINIIDTSKINDNYSHNSIIAIYGMGFVGLTLAVACAYKGNNVIGIDTDKKIINELKRGRVRIFEEGLSVSLNQVIKKKKLQFSDNSHNINSNVHIIAVGTPVVSHKPDLSSLKTCIKNVSRNLKKNNLVIIRSTVPVGCCNKIIIPLLEKYSNLLAGRDFHIVFAPERTVEGNAFNELFSLPQIIGSNFKTSLLIAGNFFKSITETVLFLDSFEESEFCKLLNNSYRDITFAFSNAFALTAKKLNIDSVKILKAASYNYPRGSIPFPSPGVGGYCLTKDPYIYSNSLINNKYSKNFINLGRAINDLSRNLPVKTILEFEKKIKTKSKIRTLIVGVAFKGEPSTNDFRNSTSTYVGKKLEERGNKVYYYDFIIDDKIMKKYGLKIFNKKINKIDAILILNNNKLNISKNILQLCNNKKPILFYDSWSIYERSLLPENVYYSNLTKNYW